MNQWEALRDLIKSKEKQGLVTIRGDHTNAINIGIWFPLKVGSHDRYLTLFPDGTWKVVEHPDTFPTNQ